jgi:N-acetylglucosaminyldiphosphoundecaprenol N-acetyl-beta-D-mannosaminyltransferase
MTNILGINLSEITALGAQEKIKKLLAEPGQAHVVTPNPEIILEALHDEEFFYILNKAQLSLADGVGLKLAGWLMRHNIARVTGSDLSVKLLAYAAEAGIKTAILNWQDGLSSAEEIKMALDKRFPGLKILIVNVSREPGLETGLIKKINDFAPQLLFSALGFPYQEKVIYHNLKQLPSVRVALGVGGTFDFLTGRAKRAPRFVRQLGLEWLWRLLKQPRRYRRIFRATFVFLGRVFKAKFISRFRYRPNVACFLYKKTPVGPQVLLVQREDEDNHWQLPHGGTDGEGLETAGRRELREETGATNLRTVATFKNVYRYKFSGLLSKKAYRQSRELSPGSHDVKRFKFDYKGQSQGLYIAEFLGLDSEIKINFWDHTAWKWVPAGKLVESVHPVRQVAVQKFLDKFLSLNI